MLASVKNEKYECDPLAMQRAFHFGHDATSTQMIQVWNMGMVLATYRLVVKEHRTTIVVWQTAHATSLSKTPNSSQIMIRSNSSPLISFMSGFLFNISFILYLPLTTDATRRLKMYHIYTHYVTSGQHRTHTNSSACSPHDCQCSTRRA